jgi:hypothetical protein
MEPIKHNIVGYFGQNGGNDRTLLFILPSVFNFLTEVWTWHQELWLRTESDKARGNLMDLPKLLVIQLCIVSYQKRLIR